MREFIITLKATEPLVITDGSAESMSHQSLDYIPGNMLLGAMAGRWLARPGRDGRQPDDHPEFQNLFLNGLVEWGHAYPMAKDRACVPIPKSFQVIKNRPGLPTVSDNGHGQCLVINALHRDDDQVSAELAAKCGQEHPKLKRCPEGFMEPESFRRPDLAGEWNMHVSLDREKRRAAQGLLFGFSALAAGACFQSRILCQEEAASSLQALLAEARNLKVGHARSAGYGGLRLTAVEDREAVAPMNPLPDENGCLVIFLLSDYLSAKAWQNPLENLLEELRPYLGRLEITSAPSSIFTGHRLISGFNSLWRLPRSSREALEKGGVIKARVSEAPTASAIPLPLSLGGRRLEGYGRLLLNPCFLQPEFIEPAEAALAPCRDDDDRWTESATPASQRLLQLMRRKAIARETARLALEVLGWKKFDQFLEKAARSSISQNQRGNLRRLVTEEKRENWRPAFEALLEKKTIKAKWQRASANHPDTGKPQHLDTIMRDLFDPKFTENLKAGTMKLPGGPLHEDEQAAALDQLHRVFLLALLSRWEKLCRRAGSGDEQ